MHRTLRKGVGRYAEALVLCTAAAVRLAHFVAQSRLPLFDQLMIDSAYYDQWAQTLASGGWLGGSEPFFMDPLYPYFLASIYALAGHALWVVRLVQVALGVGTCALLMALGRTLGGRNLGLCTGMLFALYQPAVFEGGEIEKTAVGLFLFTASLLAFLRPTAGWALAAGLLLGIASLARGNLLLLAPLAILLLLLHPRLATPRPSPVAVAPRLRRTAAFVSGFVLAFLPVVWRNHHVSGEWVLTTSQAGANLYLGNNPTNAIGAFTPLPFVRPNPKFEQEDFRREAETRSGRSLTATEVSSFWMDEAFAHLVRNPGFAARVELNKLVLALSDLEIPDGWSLYFLRERSPGLRMAFLSFGILFPLGLAGAVLGWPKNPQVRLLALLACSYLMSLLIFYVHSRYRIYLVPAIVPLAAVGIVEVVDRFRAGNRRALLLTLPVWITIAAASFWAAPLMLGISSADYLSDYANLAAFYEEDGDLDSARSILEEGFSRRPESAPIRCGLATLSLRGDRPYEALEHAKRCIEADEHYLDAWFLAGQANQALGRRLDAVRCYRRQLELVPGHRFAAACLEGLMSRPVNPHAGPGASRP